VKKIFLFFICSALSAPIPEPPAVRLDGKIQPKHYSVELTIAPDRDSFSGVVDIVIQAAQPADFFWINATALDIKEGTLNGAPLKVVSGNATYAGLSLSKPFSGEGKLHLQYSGKVSRNSSAGLFQLKDGNDWYVYSQFEPTDARRAFPCFDEPGFKVPWQLRLHVPKDQLAFSNTPVLSETAESDGQKLVVFKETQPLPSYLVALAVGRFDVVDAGRVGKTPLRIIAPRGHAAETAYAKATIAPLLKTLETYFGIPYPYEKLDSVAMPIANFAMENAGLITYGSSLLLSKPADDTLNRQRGFATTAAHEMAHQWFGDFVTTAWWDDIWLNEAFATWMELKAVRTWKPEWHMDTAALDTRLHAMSLDGLISARQIREPIVSDSDIANAFDSITYDKGAAVIRMFERWVGEAKFRKGVQAYLQEHKWSNATAADFTGAIGKAAGSDVTTAFNTFLDQPGVPEISMKLDCATKPKLVLSQKRSLPLGSPAQAKQMWMVPVCVLYDAAGETKEGCGLMTDPSMEMALVDAKGCPAWVLGNNGETGYYRANYQGDLLGKLFHDGATHLSVTEQAGALGDLRQLVAAGDVSPAAALALVPSFAGHQERELVEPAVDTARLVTGRTVPDDLRPKVNEFIRQTFGERARELGWSPAAADSEDRQLLRERLVPFVAQAGEDPALVAQAQAMAKTWLNTRTGIAPGLVSSVLSVAAEHGDSAFFDRLLLAVRQEQSSRQRSILYRALGRFRDPDLAMRGLDLLLRSGFDLRESFFPLLFGPLAYSETRDLPFQFVRKNLDALMARLPREVGGDFAASLPETGRAFCDAGHRDQLKAFFGERVKQYSGGERNLAQTLEGIDQCIAQSQRLGPEYRSFLSKY
jgi:cytosol alanyl aminopeptidase